MKWLIMAVVVGAVTVALFVWSVVTPGFQWQGTLCLLGGAITGACVGRYSAWRHVRA